MPLQTHEKAPSTDFEFRALEAAVNYRTGLLREFQPHLSGHVLEVGSGVGQLSELLGQVPAVERLTLVEPDAEFCKRLRLRFPHRTVVQGTIEALSSEETADVIVSVNVLEHIAEDQRELGFYHNRLAARHGMLCLFVPARPEIYAPLDGDFGHHRRYRRQELAEKLGRAGFHIVRLNYFNLIGYFAWWWSFCVLKKRGFDIGQVRLFDQRLFPLQHAWERRFLRPPIGQSLLAIARAE